MSKKYNFNVIASQLIELEEILSHHFNNSNCTADQTMRNVANELNSFAKAPDFRTFLQLSFK